VSAREDELQHSRGVPDDMASGPLLHREPPDAVVDLFLLAGFFRLARAGDLRDGINPIGSIGGGLAACIGNRKHGRRQRGLVPSYVEAARDLMRNSLVPAYISGMPYDMLVDGGCIRAG